MTTDTLPDPAALAAASKAAADAKAATDAKPPEELQASEASERLARMSLDYRMAENAKALEKMTPAQKSAAKLGALSSDPAWRQRFENGDATARKEWTTLVESAAQKNTVDDIVAGRAVFSDSEVTFGGRLSDRNLAKSVDWLRENAVPDKGIALVLKDERFAASDLQWAKDEKARLTRSPEFIKAYLAGEPPEVARMLGLNAIIVAGEKE
jgi:hypothetical protein